MSQIKAALPQLNGSWEFGSRRVPKRIIFPLIALLVVIIGILSPLFDLNHIHGVPSAKLYAQHLYFDGIGDAGGYWAATFCHHWYHRIPIAVGFALLTTFCLITLIG